MAYKILINKQGVPVLVEVPEKPTFSPLELTWPASKIKIEVYKEALSTALADESKHIAFKDEWDALNIAIGPTADGYSPDKWKKENIGQSFDLPENIGVSFVNQYFDSGDWRDYKEGFIYEAFHPDKNRRVAILKTLPPNSEDKGVGELDLKLTPELERTLKDLKKIQESIENLFTAFRIPKDRI